MILTLGSNHSISEVTLTDIIIYAAAGFMVWMCLDCITRREHFIWIVIMVVLFPIGAVVYYFAVKAKAGGKRIPIISSTSKEIETDETIQLKDLIEKFHKPYHYEKLGQTCLSFAA